MEYFYLPTNHLKKIRFKISFVILLYWFCVLQTQQSLAQCSNISPNLTCSNVVVSFPFNLTFTGTEGGIMDANNNGTGFTMVQAPSKARLTEDGVTPTFASAPGYEPSKINISGGNLLLTANKGIFSTTSNNQINTLGVGLKANNKKFNIETGLLNLTTGGSFAQAGLWYGLNDKNYVKLAIIDNKIELRIEQADVSATSDGISSATSSSILTSLVKLRLAVDNTTSPQTIKGYYKIGNAAEVLLGQFNHTLGTGITLGTETNVSFAGIFDTYRNQTITPPAVPFTATFTDFSVSEIKPALSFATNTLNFVASQGGTTTSQASALNAESGNPAITLSVSNGGNWVVLPNNPQLGNLDFNINTSGLSPGSYQATITASANNYADASLTINLQINALLPVIDVWDYKFNFQDFNTTTPVSYIKDYGLSYGLRSGGLTYGWVHNLTNQSYNNQSMARARSVATYPNVPVELLTFNHLQPTTGQEVKWEMALPNGYYYVKVSVGDIQSFNSLHQINAEGVKVVVFDQNAIGVGGFKQDSVIVNVMDGRLTLDASDGINTKINYIWIEALNPANDNIPPTVSFDYQGVMQSEGVYRSPLSVKINANDVRGSGVSTIEYSINGGAYQTYYNALLFEAPGDYTISARVKDGNNNQTTSSNYGFKVVITTNSNAKLVPENLLKFPNNENYVFSFIQKNKTNVTLYGPTYDYPNNENYNQDVNVIRLHNKGISPLIINSLALSDGINFKITKINNVWIGTGNGQTLLANLYPIVVPQNGYVDITTIFAARNLNTRVLLFHEKLTVYSNDDTAPVKVLNLHGLYQQQQEGDREPRCWEMAEAGGFKTKTGFDATNTNHTAPMDDEIYSPYFVRVDASKPVKVRQVAAYHGCCNNSESIAWQPKSSGANNWFFTHHPKDGQTMLPRKNNGDIGESTFDPTEAFSIRIAGDNTDPARNTFTGTIEGVSYPNIRGVRIWKAVDWNGNVIPNAFIFAHDYLSGSANLDYNDNMYYIENIRPEVGSAYYSELASGNGIVNDANQKQSSLEFNATNAQNISTKILYFRSLGQTYPSGINDPNIIISGVEVIGTNLNEFSANLPTDQILSPGENGSLTVTFRPQTVGIKNAILLVHYNSDASPLRIPLYGLATSDCYNLTLNKRIKAAAAINFVVNGRTWEQDVPFRTGNTKLENTSDNTSEIFETDDDPLYRAYLSSIADNQTIGYNMPLSNGKYLIRLHFAENQYNTSGSRVNGIYLEGNLVQANYDIYSTVGLKTATVRDFEVNIVDGALNLQLAPVIGRPALAAMEIYTISSTLPMTLTASQINGANCGSSAGSIQVNANNVANGVSVIYKLGKYGQYQASGLFSNLKAGSYTLYAKEDKVNGCEIEALFTVPELNNNITFTLTNTPVSCEATSDGTATVSNISGGTAPYSIKWNTYPDQTSNTATGLPIGSFTTVTITDATGCSKTQSVVISNTLTCPIRINSAGPAYTTIDGKKFIADQYFTNGQVSSINRPIEGTDNDVLYQSERWNNADLVYNVPVVNGNYQVILHFAEIYFSNPTQRIFNVNIEGARVLTNFDIVANAGAKDVAITKTFNTNVSDGFLNITFGKGTVDNPKVSAIELIYTGVSGNNPPTLGTPVPDQVASKGAFFNFTVSEYTFVDSDPNTTLTFSASLANGDPLPTWLIFNPTTRKFSGTPALADIGQIAIKVTVTDNAGASAEDEFGILINDGTGGTIGGNISFLRNRLKNVDIGQPSSLQFGPDGKLYVAQVNGLIKVFTIQRNGAGDYTVTNTESIDLVQKIPNHDDNGVLNPSINTRQVLGILVTGTTSNPVIYVSSNDPRTGGGNGDLNLDTNSGTISKLTKNGTTWEKVDLIRGLPKSEHNHATNGLFIKNNKLYIAQGGHANKGAPSHELAWTPEYAYSAAILEADLTVIEALATQGTGNNKYKYDLPTLNPFAGVSGPFGGDDGYNQAVLVPNGPVQIYAPGFRNAYDVVITEKGNMYTWDNSSNAGWGYPPIKDPNGLATNLLDSLSTTLPANYVKTIDNYTYYDPLHRVTKGYYGGNPNPTRANPAINTFNGKTPVPNGFNWGFPHTVNQANGTENNFLHGGRDGEPAQNASLVGIYGSTNGLTEYRATNFNGQMKGNLIATSFNGNVYRVVLNEDGTALDQTVPHNGSGRNGLMHLAEGFDTWNALDVTTQGDADIFPGSIWIAEYGQNQITILEPVDFNQCNYASPTSDLTADFDSDGYTNGDEISNNTDPCSPASIPDDWDKDKLSDLNDTDDDNDGILDINDAFAMDKDNGTKTTIPVKYEWEASAPNAGYILNTGFTGLMINGTANYKNLYNPDNMTVIGTAGFFTIDFTNNGTSQGNTNNQQYAFQFGVNAVGFPGKYQMHTAIIQPFGGYSLGELANQSFGVFLGKGDQSNYIKLVADANDGIGGLRLVYENNDVVQTNTLFEVEVLGKDKVHLYLIVNPFTNEVQPAYNFENESITLLGSPIVVPAVWLQNVIATGILSSSGSASPITVTWDFFRVEPVPSSSEAVVTINSGNTLESTTTTASSFKITNNSPDGQKISKVVIDLSNGVFPDMVFDPANAIKDLASAKAFTVDAGGASTGYTTNVPSQPFLGSVANGYTRLEINFTDFDAGETFEFSIDTDPTTIKGTAATNTTGNVSGLELLGATVSISFSDISGYTEQLYRINNESGASTNIFKDNAPLAPTIQIKDVPVTPFETTNAYQTVVVKGVVGSQVKVLVLEGGLFLNGVPGGGFDVDTYEANKLVKVVDEKTVTIDLDGTAKVAITLSLSPDANYTTGLNHIVTVALMPDGRTSKLSNVIKIKLKDGPPAATYRINAAGPQYVTPEGALFSADNASYHNGTSDEYTNTTEIADTENDVLYQTERWGNTFGYNLPVTNGKYLVMLHFAEIYFGINGRSGVNSRVFNVAIENQPKLSNYDIMLQAGGTLKAVKESFLVEVLDGNLNINFTSVKDNAKVSAIEIIPMNGNTPPFLVNALTDKEVQLDPGLIYPFNFTFPANTFNDFESPNDLTYTASLATGEPLPGWIVFDPSTRTFSGNGSQYQVNPSYIMVKVNAFDSDGLSANDIFKVSIVDFYALQTYRVNSAGPIYTTSGNVEFKADNYFVGGNTFNAGNVVIDNTADDIIYQTERYGNFQYKFPANTGAYQITLHFAEIYHNAANARVFHVEVEGQRKLSNFDIFVEAGGKNKATTKTFYTQVNDGELTLNFINVTDNAKISAIEIIPFVPTVNLKQITGGMLGGLNNRPIIRVDVPSVSNNTVSSITFNTNGTTQVLDISKAKLFYTGINDKFANPQLLQIINNPNGSFTFNGLAQTLSNGTNYFWLTYDINVNASIGNMIDAECNRVVIDGNDYTPQISAPTGNRSIIKTDEKPGKALDFDGVDDRVEIANESLYDFTNALTVEAWIKVDNFNLNWQAIVTKGDDSWRLHRNASTNKINFAINGGTGADNVNSTSDLNDNQWHHVAGVYTGTQLQIYVDGKLEGTSNTTSIINNNTYPVMIGANAQQGNRYFDGQIDEVRIWNIARTQKQIRENMHLVSRGYETGLVGYWQFNDGTGTSARDWANDNDSKLMGGMGNTNWLDATEPVGWGTVYSANSIVSSLVAYTGTDLEITFGAIHPGNELVVTRLDNISPAGPNPFGGANKTKSYWVINNYGLKTGLAGMKLRFYIGGGFLTSTDPTTYKMYKRASNSFGTWTEEFTASTVDLNQNYIEFTGITGFSQIIIGGSGVGLPVSLFDLKANRVNDNQVKLTWKTATERNNKGFEIERSENGTDFKTLGFVEGAGNSSDIKNYQFTDNQAIGSFYYRLRQIDFDGKSATYLVRVEGNEPNEIMLYPNPLSSDKLLEISGLGDYKTAANISMQVLSANGNSMTSEIGNLTKLKDKINQKIPDLAVGVYIIRFQVGNQVKVIKLIKQ